LAEEKGNVTLNLEFHGHYAEPVFSLELKLEDLEIGKSKQAFLDFDVKKGTWKCVWSQKNYDI